MTTGPVYRPDAVLGGGFDPDPDQPPPGPAAVLARWLPTDDDPDRPLMTLSTVDADGAPDARTVLLSGYDGDLHFHADGLSHKASQLDADPRAALTLVWPDVLRQVVVRGTVRRQPAEQAASAFRKRPDYLRALAWVNTTEHALLPGAERAAVWQAYLARAQGVPHEPPPSWAGFALTPTQVTFWQGRGDRASIRLRYTRVEDAWAVTALPG